MKIYLEIQSIQKLNNIKILLQILPNNMMIKYKYNMCKVQSNKLNNNK